MSGFFSMITTVEPSSMIGMNSRPMNGNSAAARPSATSAPPIAALR
jgi:hypothetical protein